MRSLPLLLVLGLLAGCKASVSANVNASDKPSAAEEPPPPPPSREATAASMAHTSFIGVTQALKLSDEAQTKATCRCMAAAVGPAASPAFQWRGTPPTVGADALVVAVGSDKTPCTGSPAFRGPSIQGVEAVGPDVVVTLEEPRPGVPVAHGAVFQRPAGSGSLLFRVGRNAPYGQPLASTEAVCRLPLGDSPVGVSAPASDVAPSRRGYRAPVNTF